MNPKFPPKLEPICCGDPFFWSLPEFGGKYPKTPPEDSISLRGRPFFWFSPGCEENFHQTAAALRLRLVTAAKASPMQYFTV